MFLVERALSPRPSPAGPASDSQRRLPPTSGAFLEPAAGGSFTLVPGAQLDGFGDVMRASLPAPLPGFLLPQQPRLRLALDLPPVRPLSSHALAPSPRRRSA